MGGDMKAVAGFVFLTTMGALGGCATPPPTIPIVSPHMTESGALTGYRRIVLDGQERYCRNDLATGSHTEHKGVCLTKAQWLAQQARAAEFMMELERRAAADSQLPYAMGGLSPLVR